MKRLRAQILLVIKILIVDGATEPEMHALLSFLAASKARALN